MAMAIGAVPAVVPVHDAVLSAAVVFRTARGTRLDGAPHNAVVPLEVDHVDPRRHGGRRMRDPSRAHRGNAPSP